MRAGRDVRVGDTYTSQFHYGNIQPAAADLVTLERAQQQFATLSTDHVPAVSALPNGSRIPYSPNPLFTGREEDLLTLAELVKGDGSPVVVQAAVTGIGGVGKTQLATAFAHRYGRFFHAVHWISLADPRAVPAEIATCGERMVEMPAGYSSLSLEEQIRWVLQQWHGPLPRLLIFDNCEEPELLSAWRTTTGGCRLLITSRRQGWPSGSGVRSHALKTLPRPQSVVLLKKFPREANPPFDFALDDEPTLKAIAHELGDLPLALHLAGSYLVELRFDVTPAAYLQTLQQQPLLDHPSLTAGDFSPTEHDRHVGNTFALSYDQLRADDPTDVLALELLHASAHFAPGEPIPRTLLRQSVEEAKQERFPQSIRRLVNLGLLEEERDGALRLHRLLAHFVLAADGEPEAARAAVEQALINEAYQLNEAGYPRALLPWQVHLRHVSDSAIPRVDEEAATLCINLGYHLKAVGELAGARGYFEQALAIRRAVLGEQHLDTASSLNHLGLLLLAQGEYEGAQGYFEQALAICQAVLGKKHPNTATSLNNLGLVLHTQGKYEGARSCYEQALAIVRAALGETHPHTAGSLNNLGGVLQSQGELAGARICYEQALAIVRAVLGEQHPNTATSLNNLGLLLRAQGLYGEARPYLEEALAICQAVLGEKHPSTAMSLNNLGGVLHAQGELAGAQSCYKQALTIRRAELGEQHPDVASSLNNLGLLLHDQGKYKAARPYLEEALAIVRAELGEQHPSTAASLNNLGLVLHAQGELVGARSCYEQALAIDRAVLGEQHPNIATSLNNLGGVLQAQGELVAAQGYFEQALAIRRAALGETHPYTKIARENLQSLNEDLRSG